MDNTPHSDSLLALARERFGLDYLFPYQRLVITNILAAAHSETDDAREYGKQIVILPTGAGKSLCFQLPAAALSGTTLVIYPLLSLMNDQARRMSEGGFSVVQLKGGQSREERRAALDQVRAGTLNFVITNPETLQDQSIREVLRSSNLIHAVIDEAHCISEWGDSFRPLYLTLGEAMADLEVPIVTAFTATAGDHVLQRIREVLFRGDGARVIRGNPDRENISYSVVPCLSRLHALRSIFRSTAVPEATPTPGESDASRATLPVWYPGEPIPLPAIVFCATRADTRLYAAHLERVLGTGRAFHYHAGLEREEKKRVEECFFHATDAVLCATCAYGMGVDKPDIRAVIHTYLPATVEAFLQESGRGGRDRRPAFSVVLIDPSDEKRYLNNDTPGTVQRMAFGPGCRREPLLREMGTEPDACAGCDRCESGHSSGPPLLPHQTPVASLISSLVMHAPRRFTATEWIRLLRGVASWQDRCRGFPRRSGFGALRHWTTAELQAAIQALTALEVLRVRRDGRVTTGGRPARTTYWGGWSGRRQKGSPPIMPAS
jgi:ATP-dependent DNA helicase RecQ